MKSIDVFPAIVRLAPPDSLSDITQLPIRGDAPQGTRKLDRCRIVCINGVVQIVVDSPEGPRLMFREAVSEQISENKTHWLRTEKGKILVFEKDNNCGCGSRLRSWNPYGTSITSSQDPV